MYDLDNQYFIGASERLGNTKFRWSKPTVATEL